MNKRAGFAGFAGAWGSSGHIRFRLIQEMNRFWVCEGGGSVLLNQRNIIREKEKGRGNRSILRNTESHFLLSGEAWVLQVLHFSEKKQTC